MIVVTGLYFAKALLIPLTLSVLLSFVLSPVCSWLERWRIGRIPAVLVTAFLGFSLLGMVIAIAVMQLSSISPNIPEYQRNIDAKFRSINQYAESILASLSRTASGSQSSPTPSESLEPPRGTLDLPFSVRVLASPTSPLQVLGSIYGSLIEALGSAGIVIVLVIFFLVRREDLRDRFVYLVGKSRVTITTQTMQEAGVRVSSYLSTLTAINLAFGVSVGVGLTFIGVPNAILCGILAMALRFIPYIGPWIAAAVPIVLSLAMSTGWMSPILTIVLFVVLELANNNFIEPWIYGKNTGISPVAVLVAAFFWMWLWGPVGLLLATPLTVCVLVVGKHVPQLSFLNILLGTEPVFEPQERIYQRLLVGNQEQAVELFDEYAQEKQMADAFDTVLIPALAAAETHWQLGELNEGKYKFIVQCLKEMVEYRSELQKEAMAKAESKEIALSAVASEATDIKLMPELSILCMPARSMADEITAMMLSQVLEDIGHSVAVIPIASLASEIVDSIVGRNPSVIFISAMPPAAVMHSHYLCKRLRDRLPEVQLMLGLWGTEGDLRKAKERIGCNASVVASLVEAQTEIRSFAEHRSKQ
jgi:predicted PurR-regulated permease PerM